MGVCIRGWNVDKRKHNIMEKKVRKRWSCLHQGIDINTPKVGDVAHLLPVMGHVVGGDEDEL
jgi:hypothetical protein